MKKKNWRTTAFGLLTILVAVMAAGKALVDNDPSTNPDWTVLYTQVMLGFGLLAAKDGNVTGGTVPATPEAVDRLGG